MALTRSAFVPAEHDEAGAAAVVFAHQAVEAVAIGQRRGYMARTPLAVELVPSQTTPVPTR